MPAYTWRVPTNEPVLYLTFDDGPIPEVTPWVLDTLAAYQAKATFFCVGDNVRKHPDVFQRIQHENHAIGNHTFNHLNGWKTETNTYLQNIAQCAEIVPTGLFRPPYGRLKNSQKNALKGSFQLIMWDVLCGDFDKNISPEQCLQNVLKNAQKGSIVVLHDSLKAEKNMRFVLPAVLEHFSQKGFRFEKLSAPTT